MNDPGFIGSDNFDSEAGRSYINPIIDVDEFWEDLGRIKYVKRLFNKFRQTGDLKTNLIINHLMIMYNVFEPHALTRMLFFKFEGYHSYLKPFLILLQRLPDQITPYTAPVPTLYTSDIIDNEFVVEELRKVLNNG